MAEETVLVTGGGGYIGSHCCKALRRAGYLPVTFDNFVTGWREAVRFGPLEAIGAAGRETWHLTTTTFAMLWRMVNGTASLQNLSGPITIAQYANVTAGMGLAWFLSFLALLSLSLAIINLLPIPILDGGHLLYYLIELVKGSPVSERVQILGQYVGLAMLAGLMGLAFYNDLIGLFSRA